MPTVKAIGLLIPDPSATVRCLEDTACSELEADTEEIVRARIDIDPFQTFCSSDASLYLCDSTGTCIDIDCAEACAFIQASSVGCAFSEADGYDKCECAL